MLNMYIYIKSLFSAYTFLNMRELFTNKLRATITSSMKTNMASFVIFQRPSHDPASFSGWDDPQFHAIYTSQSYLSRQISGGTVQQSHHSDGTTSAHSRSQPLIAAHKRGRPSLQVSNIGDGRGVTGVHYHYWHHSTQLLF